jgi:hypothetical protein
MAKKSRKSKKSRRKSRKSLKPIAGKCPKGMIIRDAYSRKAHRRHTRSGKSIKVKPKNVSAICIKDRGNPGKGAKLLPKLAKGTLGKFGYAKDKPLAIRMKALIKASKNEPGGALSVYRRLIAIATLLKNTDPESHKKFRSDARRLKSKFGIGKKSKKSKK